MRALFIPSPDLDAEMAKDPEYQAGLEAKAEEVKAKVEAFARAAGAPWMPRDGHEVIEVEVAEDGAVFVTNTDYAGHLQEWGSIRNPPHAPLRRGASAAGLDVDESPT